MKALGGVRLSRTSLSQIIKNIGGDAHLIAASRFLSCDLKLDAIYLYDSQPIEPLLGFYEEYKQKSKSPIWGPKDFKGPFLPTFKKQKNP